MNGSLGAYRAAASNLDNLSPQTRALAEALIKAGVQPSEIISGYRSPERNAAVGGARNSQHIQGSAIDIGSGSWPEQRRQQVLQAAIAAGARGIGIYPSGSLHFDTRATPAFWGPNGYKGSGVETAPQWARGELAKMFGQPVAQGGATPRAAAPAASAGLLPADAAPMPAPVDVGLLQMADMSASPMQLNLMQQAQGQRQAAAEQAERRKRLFSSDGLAGLYR